MSAQTTWMSGGSGSGVYDPVTTADVQFSESEGWFSKGKGRTYKFGTYKQTGVKAVCDEIRNRSRPRCLLMSFVATVVLILLMLIIVIASSRNTAPSLQTPDETTGLFFIPPGYESTGVLKYSQEKGQETSYAGYVQSLNDALENNHGSSNIYSGARVVCNETYHPAHRVCQQPLTLFGKSCKDTHKFGYPAGQPCILLYFKLPQNYSARGLVPKDGKAYTDAEKAMGDRFNINTVGLSCEPASPEDAKRVNMTSPSATSTAPIEYNPADGFPAYFFRNQTVKEFIPPAVMVQFNTIHTRLSDAVPVRFTCTAWGKAADAKGNIINPDGTFKTSFAFQMN